MSASKEDRVYKSGPRPHQKHFPARAKTVKSSWQPRANMVREQSTLTQIDFYTPRSSFVSTTSLDEDEYDADRPQRKRRKHAGRAKGQTTITQMIPRSDDTELELDGNAWMHELEDTVVETPERNVMLTIEAECTLQNSTPGTLEEGSHADRDDTALMPATPKMRFPDEIPFSQTPESILRTQTSRTQPWSPQRTPLKHKDRNIVSDRASRSPINSPEKSLQNLLPTQENVIQETQIMFRKPELPVKRVAGMDSVLTAGGGANVRGKLLRARSTIPDSQFDEADEPLDPANLPKCGGHHPIIVSSLPIQETQLMQSSSVRHSQFQNTYDPVWSALDRDAERYMQTQRLFPSMHDVSRTNNSQEQPNTHHEQSDDMLACQMESQSVEILWAGPIARPPRVEVDLTIETQDFAMKHSSPILTRYIKTERPESETSPILHRPSQATTVGGSQTQMPRSSTRKGSTKYLSPLKRTFESSPPPDLPLSSPPDSPSPHQPGRWSANPADVCVSSPKSQSQVDEEDHGYHLPSTLSLLCRGNVDTTLMYESDDSDEDQISMNILAGLHNPTASTKRARDMPNPANTARRKRFMTADEIFPDTLLKEAIPLPPALRSATPASSSPHSIHSIDWDSSPPPPLDLSSSTDVEEIPMPNASPKPHERDAAAPDPDRAADTSGPGPARLRDGAVLLDGGDADGTQGTQGNSATGTHCDPPSSGLAPSHGSVRDGGRADYSLPPPPPSSGWRRSSARAGRRT